MFKKLFGKGDSSSGDQREGSFHRLGWVAADRNPYGVLALDCRSYTRAQTASSKSPAEAARFLRLRASDGRQYVGRSPDNARQISCRLEYPPRKKPNDGPVFRARVMEDKWDAFQFEGRWFFVRSWSGRLAFCVDFEQGDEFWTATGIEYDPEATTGEASYLVAQADFLVKNLVFGWKGPHPLPSGCSENSKEIAELSFSLYGRQASFATFEETTGIRLEAGD